MDTYPSLVSTSRLMLTFLMQPKHNSSRVHSSCFTMSGGFWSPLALEYTIVELFLLESVGAPLKEFESMLFLLKLRSRLFTGLIRPGVWLLLWLVDLGREEGKKPVLAVLEILGIVTLGEVTPSFSSPFPLAFASTYSIKLIIIIMLLAKQF